MLFPLASIFIVLLLIILGISKFKVHPSLVLFLAALILGFLLQIPIEQIVFIIFKGLFEIVKNLGLLIIFGIIIGVLLEKSGGTHSLARGVLKYLKRIPLPYAISLIGYLVSIPVFCDAAFVILSNLNKTLSKQGKIPITGLTVALSTGLFAPHVLVPPTPGPLAAAYNLKLDNLFLLVVFGSFFAFILVLIGATYAYFLIKKKGVNSNDIIFAKHETRNTPSFGQAILPIIAPIFLLSFGPISNFTSNNQVIIEIANMVSHPIFALGIGMTFSFHLIKKNRKKTIIYSFKESFKKAIPILLITGMGGGLGKVIQTIPFQDYFTNLSFNNSFGLLIPFLIAAFLKTAQGSSTVAIITSSSICLPLLPLIGLETELGKVWIIMAIGVGSMTVSHLNDSYFWIVSQMSMIDTKTALKTHTLGTFIQGIAGFTILFICYTVWLNM
ncbi:GntP family permease [bacterium]|nr:GntP family permease [bacterium]